MQDSGGGCRVGMHIYIYVPNQCLHPLHTGLAVIPHPRWVQSPFHGDGYHRACTSALAWLHGYLPDTHADGCLTPGKPHPIAHVLEAGAAKASLQLW